MKLAEHLTSDNLRVVTNTFTVNESNKDGLIFKCQWTFNQSTKSHLRQLPSIENGTTKEVLLEALREFAHVCTSGAVPKNIAPFFFGAFLCALRKKDGGIRPIAVGSVLRRMISKALCHAVRERAAALLAPNQLGIKVHDGAVIAVHEARRFISPTPVGSVLVKLYF